MRIPRWMKRTVPMALLAGVLTGCCVVPPHGWGHGARGYGGRTETIPERGEPRWNSPPPNGYRGRGG